MRHLVKEKDKSLFDDLVRSYKYQALILIQPTGFLYLRPEIQTTDKKSEYRKAEIVEMLLLQLANGTDVDLYPAECDDVYNGCPAEGVNPNIALA